MKMKLLTWILIALYVLLALALLLVPSLGPQPWQIYIAMPLIGAVVQLIAQSRGFRLAGFIMTIIGIAIIVLILKDEAKWNQRATRAIWEAGKRQAEQAAGTLRR